MKDYKWNLVFEPLLKKYKPKTFCEIGCHEGLTLKNLCPWYRETIGFPLHYIGYDAFDLAIRPTFQHPINPFTNEFEHNGKETASYDKVISRCKKFVNSGDLSNFNIIRGWTHNTLKGPLSYDMVYIDGGHSYQTVKWDYEQVKDSKVIIFDDTYEKKFPGVAQFLNELKETKKVEEIIHKNEEGKVLMQCAFIINI